MSRIKCVVSYDGTHFSGFQIQPNARTIQGEIEAVLKRMHKGDDVRIHASGRTDAGVHAYGQVFHFDTPLTIPERGWLHAFNTQLPEDIIVMDVAYVSPSFHARHSAVSKEYHYRVLQRPFKDIFRRHFTHHVPQELDIDAMKQAASYLIGTHDFTSFSSAKAAVNHKVRTLTEVEVKEQHDEIVFRFKGTGFLYNMVRIMVGTLLDVGRGFRSPEMVETILRATDRTKAGVTAPSVGLILWEVSYEEAH